MPNEPDGDFESERDEEAHGAAESGGPRGAGGHGDGEEPASRRVLRARRDRVFGGVCGGLARVYGLDPTFVRVLTVLASFVGGAGIVAYVVALFLMPIEAMAIARAPVVRRPRQDPALAWVGAALVVGGVVVLSRFELFALSLFTPSRGAFWPLLLAAAAILVVKSRRRRPAAPALPLSRPRRDRIFLGVASGFARHGAVDANLVRLVLVVIAAWSYGIGALLYLAIAAFMPEDVAAA